MASPHRTRPSSGSLPQWRGSGFRERRRHGCQLPLGGAFRSPGGRAFPPWKHLFSCRGTYLVCRLCGRGKHPNVGEFWTGNRSQVPLPRSGEVQRAVRLFPPFARGTRRPSRAHGRPDVFTFHSFSLQSVYVLGKSFGRPRLRASSVALATRSKRSSFVGENTTLSGGSLGSCVDEERSQLRELM